MVLGPQQNPQQSFAAAIRQACELLATDQNLIARVSPTDRDGDQWLAHLRRVDRADSWPVTASDKEEGRRSHARQSIVTWLMNPNAPRR